MYLVFFFFIELILSLRWDFSRVHCCLQIRNLMLLWEHFSWASEIFDRWDIFDYFDHVTPLFVNFLQHISYQAGQCLTKILDSFYSCLHFFDMRNQLWIFSGPGANFESRKFLIHECFNLLIHQFLNGCVCLHLVVQFLLVGCDFALQRVKNIIFESVCGIHRVSSVPSHHALSLLDFFCHHWHLGPFIWQSFDPLISFHGIKGLEVPLLCLFGLRDYQIVSLIGLDNGDALPQFNEHDLALVSIIVVALFDPQIGRACLVFILVLLF